MGFFDDAIGTLGKSLATTATSYLSETTGFDVGGTLAYLFGDGQQSKAATLDDLTANITKQYTGDPAGLALLQNDLNAQSAAISEIGTKLTAMASAIADIAGEIQGIEAMLTKIDLQQRYQSWQMQDDLIKAYITKIDSSYKQYAEFITDQATPANVAAWAASITDPNNGELNASMEINSYMLADQQNKGALQLWAEMTCPLIEAGLLDYRQAVDQFFAYYTKLTWAQLRATNLIMEAYHFQTGDNQLAAQAWTDYKGLILGQENEFIDNVVQIVRSGLAGSIANSFAFTAYHAASQFHPDMYTAGGAYYEVSSVFQAAEALLASLALTDQDDRRLVVHMTYFGDAFKTAIDAVPITLQMAGDQSGPEIAPSGQPAQFGPMASPSNLDVLIDVDPNWLTDDTFWVNRIVYSGSTASPLGDGTYQLTDLNGRESLQPMNTYMGTIPFQSAAVGANTMQVNATQQFDFMNFAGYFASARVSEKHHHHHHHVEQ